MLKRQTSRSHYGSKVPAVTITVFKYRNKIDCPEFGNFVITLIWLKTITLRTSFLITSSTEAAGDGSHHIYRHAEV
jgi:hypothetical protein